MDAFFIPSKRKQRTAKLTAEGNKWPCTWSAYTSVIEVYSVGKKGRWFFSPSLNSYLDLGFPSVSKKKKNTVQFYK